MGDAARLEGWPEGSQFVLLDGEGREIIAGGRRDGSVPWASVTKLALAFGVLRAVARGDVDVDEPAGPPGSTLAHLLSHSSGLGLEATDGTFEVGTRRIYSNVGIETALAVVTGGEDAAAWMAREVFEPLGLSSCVLEGRPSAGAIGSLSDMAALGVAWASARSVTTGSRDLFVRPFLADLAGVVPGYGRFVPCPWGLGPEVHGTKDHWMGSRPSPAAYGHFGRSGSLLLVDPDRSVVVAAAASEPFGPWAVARWGRWMDETFDRYVP